VVEILISLIFLAILMFAVYTILQMPMFSSVPQAVKTLVYLLIFVLVFAFVLTKLGLMPAGLG
jgi:hypothetical protein